ncbi:hypothetical protein KJB29_09505 [Geobacter grbiciae]|nr:hypothetical protein [Geobacter metallireducens]MBT1075495.1 hypothetical protein [Geobacter grbiciae]
MMRLGVAPVGGKISCNGADLLVQSLDLQVNKIKTIISLGEMRGNEEGK